MTRRGILVGLIALTATGVPALSHGAKLRDRTEQPKYEVVKRHPDFEVRTYAPRIVAEVDVKGTAKEATTKGFRVLADFIFGNNTAREKVAMTAPVDRSERIPMTTPVDRSSTKEGRWTVTFTMPAEYTMDTLPRPNDDRIRIRRVPPTRFAALRFSGNPKESKVQQYMSTLQAAVKDAGYQTPNRPPVYARYDPPWTPGFMRRNEVLLELLLPQD